MPTDPSRRQATGNQHESQKRTHASPEAGPGREPLHPEGANRQGTGLSRSSAAARGVADPSAPEDNRPAADSVPKALPSRARGEASPERLAPRRDDAADGARRADDGEDGADGATNDGAGSR